VATNKSTTFEELWTEFQGVDLSNDRDLIDWLGRVFVHGYEQGEEIPFREDAAIRIGRTRHLLPNPNITPHFHGDRREETEWVLVSCINALITHPDSKPLQPLYEYTASVIEVWLMAPE
jgi:hypothetical protein